MQSNVSQLTVYLISNFHNMQHENFVFNELSISKCSFFTRPRTRFVSTRVRRGRARENLDAKQFWNFFASIKVPIGFLLNPIGSFIYYYFSDFILNRDRFSYTHEKRFSRTTFINVHEIPAYMKYQRT